MLRGATVRIQGVVQAVGFRPFIYRLAVRHNLKGYVANLEDATVEIFVEGEEKAIKDFLKALPKEAPKVSQIESVEVSWGAPRGYRGFEIRPSQFRRMSFGSIIPPDISICEECVKDMFRPGSRWYLYPFTCCAQCGPRFTSVWALPYDRQRTNMADFPLCEDCLREYEDPMDRRFHAQGICCSRCGPRMMLVDRRGEALEVDEPVREAAKLLKEGYIVAVKGIGGVHLAALAVDDEPVLELRKRKRRPYQPFALMSPDLEAVRSFADVSSEEEKLLVSWRKPIVVLRKSGDYYLSEWVSPGLDTVGVMLPYTGIHILLLRYCGEPALIMTSGNPSGLPMAISNEEALRLLGGIADFFLLHNRRIINRCDDSVVRLVDGMPILYRRSRGFVPSPIEIPMKMEENQLVLSLGAELRNVGAILYRSRCFPTQYIGDTDNMETLDYLREAVHRLKGLLGIEAEPTAIAHDLNPAYLTTRLAKELSENSGCRLVAVQHHHAHLASLMAEWGLPADEQIVGIVMDGVGYGADGDAWGGEVLVGGYEGFRRVGHLERQPMPGGDLCALYPDRMLLAVLLTRSEDDRRRVQSVLSRSVKHLPHGDAELRVLLAQLRNPSLHTTSAGRFLDAVSALADVCHRRTYEGEPAIRLEAAANRGRPDALPLAPQIADEKGVYVLKTGDPLYELACALEEGRRRVDVCAAAQEALARGMAEIAIGVAEERGIKTVGVSGGVFMNAYILRRTRQIVEDAGLRFLHHRLLPPGDGGLCVGQAAVAAAKTFG
ncbi:carbamoyltransferase HypF [Candidatus Bathyarchaeota archaeon]|nr:MAG: carbamoyltransferase HypF [Candidatus Bathyarchaeota archaeon]